MSTQDNNRGIYVPAQTFLVGVVTFLMAVLLALFSLTINIVRDHTVNIAMLHGRLSVVEAKVEAAEGDNGGAKSK